MGESISTGILAKWHVKDGDLVKRDQPLFELETDKITSEGDRRGGGRHHAQGRGGRRGEDRPGRGLDRAGAAGPVARGRRGRAPKPAPDAGARAEAAAPSAAAVQSPAVRRLAEETGVNPAAVAGTGKAGRVTKGDMLSAGRAGRHARGRGAGLPRPRPAPARRGRSSPRCASGSPSASSPPSTSAALLTTFNEVDMSAVMELRAKYQEDFVKRNGLKLGFMSVLREGGRPGAEGGARRSTPRSRATPWSRTTTIDIGVAVSTEKGLMVPVIRDCDSLGMAGIEKAIADVGGQGPRRQGSRSPTSRAASSRSRTAAPSARCFRRRSSIRRRAPSSGCTRSTTGPSPSAARSSSGR